MERVGGLYIGTTADLSNQTDPGSAQNGGIVGGMDKQHVVSAASTADTRCCRDFSEESSVHPQRVGTDKPTSSIVLLARWYLNTTNPSDRRIIKRYKKEMTARHRIVASVRST